MIFFFVSVINDFFFPIVNPRINNRRRWNGYITQNTETTFAFNPFFFNTQCNFGKKKETHSKAGIDKQLHFLSNPAIQTKPAWKKKEEISLNNKTFAFNHHFCLENVWIINQTIFFSSSRVFLNDFCSCNKRKVLKREAFS